MNNIIVSGKQQDQSRLIVDLLEEILAFGHRFELDELALLVAENQLHRSVRHDFKLLEFGPLSTIGLRVDDFDLATFGHIFQEDISEVLELLFGELDHLKTLVVELCGCFGLALQVGGSQLRGSNLEQGLLGTSELFLLGLKGLKGYLGWWWRWLGYYAACTESYLVSG